MTSPDLTQSNIEKLAELFPSVITETRDDEGEVVPGVDFDLLRQELSDHLVEGPKERYQLDWPGKRQAAMIANAPIAKTLRPMLDESVDFDTTKNIFIEGDNLDVLKLLQESYLGKVKLIYIDPPYNTGGDFVYEDDFAETTKEYLERSGQVDDEGTRLVANPETSGRYHSDWLSMMYPRLKLARNLLREDGFICVSIDGHERSSLELLLDEVFGRGNAVGTLVWRRRTGATDAESNLSQDHEYILVYSRSGAPLAGRPRTFEKYRNPDEDPRGPWMADNLSAGKPGGDTYYAITDPSTGWRFFPPKGRYWPYNPATMDQKIAEGRVLFPPSAEGMPMLKRFQREAKRQILPVSSWMESDPKRALQSSLIAPMNSAATRALTKLMGGRLFTFPKSVLLIKNLVAQTTAPGDIVMDFFAGSGTTAQAVLEMNLEDDGDRRFILVQADERTEEGSPAREAGYASIPEFARERIQRAAKMLSSSSRSDVAHMDCGFRSLQVAGTTFGDVARLPADFQQLEIGSLVRTVRDGRKALDFLFQVLLEWGLELSLPITARNFAGYEVLIVDDGVLAACFDDEIDMGLVREMAALEPLRAVFLDSSFRSDAERINAEQIFEEVSPITQVKVI